MAARMKHVGDSNDNPGKAVHTVTVGEKPPAESEVMGIEPRESVSGSGQAQGPAVSGQPVPQGPSSGPVLGAAAGGGTSPTTEDPLLVAFLGLHTAVVTWRNALDTHFQSATTGQHVHHGTSRVLMGPAILAMARVLRARPNLLPRVSPADLEAGAARADAMQQTDAALTDLLARVQDTDNVDLARTWKDARDVYHAATRLAPEDPSLALAIEPMRAAFQKTPRVQKAAADTGLTALNAVNAANRATRASSKASTARRRAAALSPPLLQPPTPEPSGVDQGPAHPASPGPITPTRT